MKKKMSILAVLVLAVTVSMYSVAGTYAKYTSTKDISSTATVAKWNINFTDGTNTLTDGATFDLGRTADANVVDGKIAPGTEGSFALGINAKDTEVSFKYGISFTVANKPAQLKFYSDSAYANEIALVDGKYSLEEDVILTSTTSAHADENKVKTVYWKWVFEDNTTNNTGNDAATADEILANNDAADTALGENPTTMTVNAKITATQLD